MHRFTAFVLSLALIASLAACGGTGGMDGDPVSDAQGASADAGAGVSDAAAVLSGEIGGEITVSTYDTMRYKAFLEDAARLFEQKYPGTKVNVETFSAMPEVKTSEQGGNRITAVQMEDDPQGRQDYINKVSTALMSGKGADVLAMDVLPIHKYVEGGQLENLAAYMEADPAFNRADYRQNILDAVQYRDGTWFIPMNYTFDYYAYDSTLLSGEAASGFGTGSAFSAEQLIGIAEGAFDGGAKLFNSPDYLKGPGGGMWNSLLKENYASFVDLENKAANFEDGSFAALLESVRQYSEKGYVPMGTTGREDAGAMMHKAGEQPTERFFYKPKNVFSLIGQFTRGSGLRINIMTSGGVVGIEDDDEIAGIAAGADGSVPFTYDQAYGINANSENKQTAWAFLKFLLSEKMQLNTNLMPTALPLLNSARAQRAEQVLSGALMGRQGQPLDKAQQEALGKYSEAVERLSDQINAYVFEDTVVNDMIAAEVAYFFEGTKTAGQVASVLQNKVELYLNE